MQRGFIFKLIMVFKGGHGQNNSLNYGSFDFLMSWIYDFVMCRIVFGGLGKLKCF